MSENTGNSSCNHLSLVPVENQSNVNTSDYQPRQPKTLQDVLRISTGLQNTSIQPTQQLTEERSQFLKKALDEMTGDFVSDMKKLVNILKEIETTPDNVKANLKTCEDTLELLFDFVIDIDLASLFFAIDGMAVILPLLQSEHASLRSRSANIILESCRNNPTCQSLSVTDEIFSPLMEMATSDPNKDAMFKAIGAISAIIRYNPDGISQFNRYNGMQMVEKAFNSDSKQIVNRAIVLVKALCDTDDNLKKSITESGIIVTLINLLEPSDFIVKEYILEALISIAVNNSEAQQICQKQALKTYLIHLFQTHRNPEHQDMVESAKNLQKVIEGTVYET